MSHLATNWAVRQKGLKPATKIVLWHLADRHNPDGGCFPMQKTLADDCEMSRSTLNLHLDKLEELGLIRRETAIDEKTKRQRPTRYFFAFEAAQPVSENHTRTVSDNRTQEGKAVSDFQAEPCPDFGESRVRNPDTNSVREPVKDPRKKKSTAMPEDAVISERMLEIAKEEGFSDAEARAQFGRFKSGALANGRTYVNWDAAWRNWFASPYFKLMTPGGKIDSRNDTTFGALPNGRPHRSDPALEQIARLTGLDAAFGHGRG